MDITNPTRDGWIYDSRSGTLTFGTASRGCGVLYDDGGWMCNTVGPCSIIGSGPFATPEEAMIDAERALAILWEDVK